MFFDERIKSIKATDLVLEIGPGATPYWRSDVFLEKRYENKQEYIAQTGHVGELHTEKQVVFYDGDRFPFEDKEFDYVICSHVLEHVENPDLFLKEIQRVGKMGYLEFPTLYYDYIYNFPEHPMLLNYDGETIKWMRKSSSGFNDYKGVQAFFYRSCELEYYSLINELKVYFFQGFEWSSEIKSSQVDSLDKLCFSIYELSSIPRAGAKEEHAKEDSNTFKRRLKNKLINLINKW